MSKRAAAQALLAALVGLCLSGSVLAGRGGHSGHSGGRSGHSVSSGGFHGGGVRHFNGGHFRSRVFIGGAVVAPLYFPPPYYYPPAYYYPPPAQYIEQYPAPSAAPQSSYWYYCPASGAYYPYVQQCPGGWQQVAPQPPS